LLNFYKTPAGEWFRGALSEINKLRMVWAKLQGKTVDQGEVTPEEVGQSFYTIPEDGRLVCGAALRLAQTGQQPEAPEEEKQEVIDQLKEIRQDVLENDASFNVKAILYSQDPGSKSRGGLYSMTKETQFVKEFKDVAFSLREGEISEPFETTFGYHIIYVEKVRGQERDIRHILMIPEIPQSAIDKAVKELDTIRQH